jgi:hypothetical protein
MGKAGASRLLAGRLAVSILFDFRSRFPIKKPGSIAEQGKKFHM